MSTPPDRGPRAAVGLPLRAARPRGADRLPLSGWPRPWQAVDAGGVEMIGNHPWAFSHIGLANAAWASTRAEEPGGR